jgi:small-conductance mechanosensitive channel
MSNTINEYIIAATYLVSGVLLGYISERILLQKLKHLTSKTSWKTDDVIINAFHNIVLFWWVIAGIYFSLHHIGLKEKFLNASDKLLLSAAMFGATIVASRILVGLVKLKTEDDTPGAVPLPSTSIITNIIRIAVFVTGILVILQSLGISVTPLLTALGVGGLAVALALQDTLSNLFSGIQVIASRQVKTGDYIRLNSGEEGFVTDITWRNTTIRMLSNSIIVVPNSKIATTILTNFNLPEKEISLRIEVGVSYSSDLEKVEQVCLSAAKEFVLATEGTVKEFEPAVRFNTFADSGVNLAVVFRIQEFSLQFEIKHKFMKVLHKRFREEGIEIPFPTRTVYLKQEN